LVKVAHTLHMQQVVYRGGKKLQRSSLHASHLSQGELSGCKVWVRDTGGWVFSQVFPFIFEIQFSKRIIMITVCPNYEPIFTFDCENIWTLIFVVFISRTLMGYIYRYMEGGRLVVQDGLES
jgi:hypothetical protein